MLTQIKLTNFKCFKEETTIPLSQFNLFTGVNGAGKSTALQALLLMRQSYEIDNCAKELVLNGSCVNLGSFDDVRNREISKENPIFFEFLYGYGQDEFLVRYHLESKFDEMNLSILKVHQCLKYSCGQGNNLETKTVSHTFNYDEESDTFRGDTGAYSFTPNFPALSFYTDEEIKLLFNPRFNFDTEKVHFISADRIGPQEVYKKSPLSDFSHVGTNGEMVVNLLNKLSDHPVNEVLYLAETPGILGENQATLLVQTQAWLGKILSPLSLKINPLRVNLLELLIGDSKPSNVGFGYSSILPIIVTGLIAKPGEKIIIENPEIHLHPKAQSSLIEFLIKVANTGVQIFIESHSDHVLNALRLATKNGLLAPEDVNILFFERENNDTKIIKPTIDSNGRLDHWPEDFFDETAKSLASLAAGQRPRIKAPKA